MANLNKKQKNVKMGAIMKEGVFSNILYTCLSRQD